MFKVVYLHTILCSSVRVVHANCVMHRLDIVALANFLVWKLKYYTDAYANFLRGSSVIFGHAKGNVWKHGNLGHVKEIRMMHGNQKFPSCH